MTRRRPAGKYGRRTQRVIQRMRRTQRHMCSRCGMPKLVDVPVCRRCWRYMTTAQRDLYSKAWRILTAGGDP